MIRFSTIFSILMLTMIISQSPAQAGHFDHFYRKPAVPKKTVSPLPPSLPTNLLDVRHKTCPITGMESLEKVAVIYEGKVYHFCHKNCAKVFLKNPTSAIARIKTATEVPLTTINKDARCPVNGLPASSDIFLVRGDTITFYCHAACVGKDKRQSIVIRTR